MRIKLDENMPSALAGILSGRGHDVDTVLQEGLLGADDLSVWARAQADARFLITQDPDFSDMRRFAPGEHHGLLLVRLRDPSRRALVEHVRMLDATEGLDHWARCFVVTSDRKVRIRRPRPQ